jgi:hypothetical protein
MDRLDHNFNHAWHLAINAFNQDKHGEDRFHGMYEAKAVADEVPRLTMLHGMERTKTLPLVHRQCSHSAPVPIAENHLTCCLGVKCAECPMLKALETPDLTPEQQDQAKGWTCVAHILFELGKAQHIDTSEGYILTVDDRMYWDTVYEHLSASDPDAEEFEPVDDEASKLRTAGYPELFA